MATQQPDAFAPELDAIIGTIRDGNESQRADVLAQIRYSKTIDRPMLSDRLRTEIRDRFGPNAETNFASAIRDPKKISSIRSWLLSCLVWTDPEDAQNKDLVLEHVTETTEPDRNVRFWALSALYVSQASYAGAAAQRVLSDSAPEVRIMGRAIISPQDQALISELRSSLVKEDFETVWQVLRVLRIVPISELVEDVCAQLDRSIAGTPLAYDTLYALSNPQMARAASPLLEQKPGVEAVVQRVLVEANSSDPNGMRNFAALLAALPASQVDRALEAASRVEVLAASRS